MGPQMKENIYITLEACMRGEKMNRNSFLILGIVLALMILPLVSAATDVTTETIFGTFKQASNVDLLQTCDNGAIMCSACNISSVKGPNSADLITNVVMTKRTSDFNYTLSGAYTTTLGIYYVSGYCTDATSMKNWYYSFTVSPAGGPENNTTIFLMLAISALIILLLSFMMHNYIFAFISGLLFLGSGVYVMIFGVSAIANQYTQILSMVIIGLGAIISVVSALEFVKEMAGEGSYGYGGFDDDE